MNSDNNSFNLKDFVCRIPPQCFIHVLDTDTNITRLETGPKTFIRKEHEYLVLNVTKMINLPPHHYCEIGNPVMKNSKGKVIKEDSGEVKLKFGDTEIRLSQPPFGLYPGEILKIPVTPLRIVQSNTALKLKAIMDVTDAGVDRLAGEEWMFEGPAVYIPNKGVRILQQVDACVIKVNCALRLRANKEFIDRTGQERITAEEWLIKDVGSYIPDAQEDIVEFVSGYVLTEKIALHLKAVSTFTDDYGIKRKNGEEWLITYNNTEVHIPSVYEQVIAVVDIISLNNRQYCVILDPVDVNGKSQLGKKKLVKGEISFFLEPGECFENGIQNVFILSENDGLILKATKEFMDGDKKRLPGDRWLIRGPAEITPPIEVEVISTRSAISLDKNEGIYVKNTKTGLVRLLTGLTYMPTETEELWEKDLPDIVEELVSSYIDHFSDTNSQSKFEDVKKRDKTRVVSYPVPHNAAVQIYDFKEKKTRILYGPDLAMLEPEEQFTLLSLSGGKPKIPNQIKSICLLLGPDFSTDILIVETSDHARLQLQVSYKWHFKVENQSEQMGSKLFSVPDFIGNACKAIASRVRGTVAAVKFDDFHKNSSRIIRTAVFGLDDNKNVRDEFIFPQNNLVITNVDIQSVEPVDQKTRESLQRSVQLAIEITTKSIEASARHEAEILDQEARGQLERQMINDQAEAEKGKTNLLKLKATSAAVESIGHAKAEAESRAESSRIEGHVAVEQAQMRAEASQIEGQQEMNKIMAIRNSEICYKEQQNTLEELHRKKMADIEITKFKNMVVSIGQNTLIHLARAGPNADVRLLQSLGLKTALITDGNNPINLFQTANGLIKKSMCNGINIGTNEDGSFS